MSTDDDEPRPLRILLVTDRVPGHDTGYGIRVANVVAGLRSAGELHVWLIDSSRYGEHLPQDAGYTPGVLRVDNPPRWAKGVRIARLVPANVRYRQPRAARAALRETVGRERWDVVWCSRARVHLLSEHVAEGPRIVDLDDLNDRLLRSEMADRRAIRGVLPTLPRNSRDSIDVRLWSRLQRRIAASVQRVVVCSESDRDHLGVDNCAVVPNGYPEPAGLRSRSSRPAARRIIFVGPLTYEPNRLAVEWLVKDVLPTIRAAVPDVELVVVGDNESVTVRGAEQPGVTLTGRVGDVAEHYDTATIAVTPLHSGGGTRIKVIEALARSVPLVSTSFACTGHDLERGRDLLVADDPASFAAACVALLVDEALHARIAARGHLAYLSNHTAATTSRAVGALTRETALAHAAAPSAHSLEPGQHER